MGVFALLSGGPGPRALFAPLNSVGEFLGWAAVAQGRRHSNPVSASLADFFSPNTKHLLPGRAHPTGGFAPAKVRILKTGPLRHLFGFRASQSRGQNWLTWLSF